jgi:hypothetical protein
MAAKVFIERTTNSRPVLLDYQTYHGVPVNLHDDTAKRALEFAKQVREFEEWIQALASTPNDTVACPKFLQPEVKKSAPKSNTRKKVSKSSGSGRSKKSTKQ